jgi:intracellular sulfur oxidation DsrE/DsrF family protein
MISATHRRGFLRRMFAAAVASGPIAITRKASAQETSPDDWISGLTGKHRCLFDFPQHKNGLPLLHVLNYLNTYATVYQAPAGQVDAVGTFYGMGPQASIPLAFNDAMWEKYGLGEYTGLKDAARKPYIRNVFARPTKNDLHVLMQGIESPAIPALGEAMQGIGIENLQKMGAKFLLCANALHGWSLELEARGRGKAPDIEKEMRANVLAGVTIVPAMVIAIEKAQEAGIRYNRQ